MPPTALPSTGRPRSCASITTRPIPSDRDGRTSRLASSSACDDLVRVEAPVPRDAALGDEAPEHVGAGAVADDPQRGVRDAARARAATPRPARRCSCTARARRRRATTGCVGQRTHGRGERLEVHERGELGRPARARPRGPARAVYGETARTLAASRTAQPPTASASRASRAASRRAVEPRERAPVAVQLDDHGHAGARGERRGRLVRALRDDRVGPEPPHLAAHAQRQREPEARTVERASGGAAETSRRRSSRRATTRRRGSRARRRPPPTCARATARAAARSARARRRARAASCRRPLEDPLRAVRRSRPPSSARRRPPPGAASLHRSARRRGTRRSAAANAAASPGATEQPVLAVGDDLRHAADARRDHRRPDRERLDDAVREVLPGRREDDHVRRAHQTERLRPRRADRGTGPARRAELVAQLLEARPVGAVADDREVTPRARADKRLEARAPRSFCGRQPPGEHERRAIVERRRARRPSARGRRVRQDASRAPAGAPQEIASSTDVRARADDMRGAPDADVADARSAERAGRRRRPGTRRRLRRRRPPRRARSNAGSEVSFTHERRPRERRRRRSSG